MGVPAFYRWLTQKYPKIVLFNIEKARADEPGLEYHNLYIDMNGLIHPCSHPEDHEPPSSEYEMYQNIAKYVDRLVAAIRPTRLLYLSVDGVAPRAKMNQQRERRYRSAQEKADRKELAESIIAEKFPDYRTPQSLAWDSNVITPGTEFMQNLMTFIRDYIEERMRTHELWRNVKVIFSDSSVPGEGEHKIMKFIRAQRAMPGYNPNLHHVIHGLDADLIMLALATHEPNFSILREEFVYNDHRSHKNSESSGKNGDAWLYAKKLECVQIGALREQLANDFYFMEEILEDYSLERIIDDFVFLCFFVGNDFLPHMPTVNIREGGIDMLLEIYKELRVIMDDYITGPGGTIYMSQLRMILERLSEYEEHSLQLEEMEVRQQVEKAERRAAHDDKHREKHAHDHNHGHTHDNGTDRGDRHRSRSNSRSSVEEEENKVSDRKGNHRIEKDTKNGHVHGHGRHLSADQIQQEVANEVAAREIIQIKQMVETQRVNMQRSVPGETAKDRYYNDAFRHLDSDARGGRKAMCRSYLEGLTWVLQYYYQGVPSWGWYYPFHYAPCASDLISEEAINPTYELGYPLRPVEQLLCVLPVESVEALPVAARHLMTSPESPIYDMFHGAIETDRRNERAWLWIQLLPFVDVNRIISAVAACEDSFTDKEKARNSRGKALLYVHSNQLPSEEDSANDSFVVAGSSTHHDKIFGHVSTLQIPVPSEEKSRSEIDTDNATESLPAPPRAEWKDKLKCFEYSLPPEAEHRSELVEGLGEVKFIRRVWGGGKRRGNGKKRGGRGRGKGQQRGGQKRAVDDVVDDADGSESPSDADNESGEDPAEDDIARDEVGGIEK